LTDTAEGKVTIGSSKTVDQVIVLKTKNKIYKLWADKDIVIEGLQFFMKPLNYGLSKYCDLPGKKVPILTLGRYLKECNIFEMKREGRPILDADKALRLKISRKTENEKKCVEKATKAKGYLTNNEELAIVQMCRILSMCGPGVSADKLLNMTNEYIHHHQDARLIQAATCKTTPGLMGRGKELVKIVQASSLDPKRAEQAREDTRDGMFFKLDAYIKVLHEMGHISCKCYKDIPKEHLFNMDEVGNDTTKH
jgi:hypothetical protein